MTAALRSARAILRRLLDVQHEQIQTLVEELGQVLAPVPRAQLVPHMRRRPSKNLSGKGLHISLLAQRAMLRA